MVLLRRGLGSAVVATGKQAAAALMTPFYFLTVVTCPPLRVAAAQKLIIATEGRFFRRSFAALAATEAGRRLIALKPDGVALLRDRSTLARMAPGSLGSAYLSFMTTEDLDEDLYLVGVRAAQARIGDPRLRWYRGRIEANHDLRHVIAGYGTDPLGETCLLVLRYSQTGNLGCLMIAGLGTMALILRGQRALYAAMREAYRRGREATLLDLIPWEELLTEPLAEIRAAFGLTSPSRYLATDGNNVPQPRAYRTQLLAA